MKSRLTTFVLVGVVAAVASTATAAIHTLQDENTVMEIDSGSSSGVFNWTVDGVNQMFQQWFWFRLGPEGGEVSIDTLGLISENAVDVDGDTYDDTLNIIYGGQGLEVQVRFSLVGGSPGSHISDLGEQIRITNTGERMDYDLHFFQYVDFDLGGTADGDTGSFLNNNTVRQSDSGAWVNETVITPAPNHREIGPFPDILDSLEDGFATTLADNLSYGPGDVTWAFQWDEVLGPGDTLTISKDKLIQVPAPGAAILGLLGVGLVGWVKRRFA